MLGAVRTFCQAGLVAGLCLGLGGCGVPVPGLGGASPLQMQVRSLKSANQNSPVAVDVVAVRNKQLVPVIAALTAAQWFQGKTQILRDHPGQVEVQSWEWVPGQDIPPIRATLPGGIKQVLIFADYSSPGAHRAALGNSRAIALTLQQKDFDLQRLKQ